MKKIVPVKIQTLAHGRDLPLPAYHSELAAGADLRAAVAADAEMVIEPGARTLVPCGIAIALSPGFEAQVRPRSGLAVRHGVTVVNAPGTIDADYRGEIMVALINLGTDPFTIRRGDRIAQLVVQPVVQAEWHAVETLDETDRGTGGFGSSGRS